jgi:hypothetical protein
MRKKYGINSRYTKKPKKLEAQCPWKDTMYVSLRPLVISATKAIKIGSSMTYKIRLSNLFEHIILSI